MYHEKRNTVQLVADYNYIATNDCKSFLILKVKLALLGLRQISGNEKLFKNQERCFLFYGTSTFRSKDIKSLP